MTPHHKPKNVHLTPRLITVPAGRSKAAHATRQDVDAVSVPLSYVTPAEVIARREFDRIGP